MTMLLRIKQSNIFIFVKFSVKVYSNKTMHVIVKIIFPEKVLSLQVKTLSTNIRLKIIGLGLFRI